MLVWVSCSQTRIAKLIGNCLWNQWHLWGKNNIRRFYACARVRIIYKCKIYKSFAPHAAQPTRLPLFFRANIFHSSRLVLRTSCGSHYAVDLYVACPSDPCRCSVYLAMKPWFCNTFQPLNSSEQSTLSQTFLHFPRLIPHILLHCLFGGQLLVSQLYFAERNLLFFMAAMSQTVLKTRSQATASGFPSVRMTQTRHPYSPCYYILENKTNE